MQQRKGCLSLFPSRNEWWRASINSNWAQGQDPLWSPSPDETTGERRCDQSVFPFITWTVGLVWERFTCHYSERQQTTDYSWMRAAQEGRDGRSGSIVIIIWIKGREQNDMDYSPNGKNVCTLHHYRLESSVIWARKVSRLIRSQKSWTGG